MEERDIRLLKLEQKGYTCGQVIILLGLEARGESNPGLVRAMAGLAHGCGSWRATCGALTAGCCLLALYAGKGSDEETGSDKMGIMRLDLYDWFGVRFGDPEGPMVCQTFAGEGCGDLVADTFAKVMEILEKHEFDLTGG